MRYKSKIILKIIIFQEPLLQFLIFQIHLKKIKNKKLLH